MHLYVPYKVQALSKLLYQNLVTGGLCFHYTVTQGTERQIGAEKLKGLLVNIVLSNISLMFYNFSV